MTTTERAFDRRFVAPLLMGSALNPVNSSMIALALVPIATSLHVPLGRTAALVAALYLASAVAQPAMGKLSEELGPRRVFACGILVVLAGGVLGGMATSLTVLIIARVLIGIGTSSAYPSAMVMIRRRALETGLVEPPGSVLGALSVAGTATAALGLPIGGLLVGAFGWRATFYANVPVALLALTLALTWLRPDPPARPGSARELASRLDAGGILGFAAAMTTLLVFLLGLPDARWGWLAAAVVLWGALILGELRARTPFLDMRLLVGNLALTRTYVRMGATMLGAYTMMYGVSQWIEAERGLSAEDTSLLLLPMTLVSAIVAGLISRRNLIRGPLIVGKLFLVAGSVAMLWLAGTTPIILILFITTAFGITMGATAVGNQTALYRQAPHEQAGTAAGLYRTAIYVGSIASSTITSIVFHRSATDDGLHTIAIVLSVVSVVLLVMTLLDRRLPTARGAVDAPQAIPAAGRPAAATIASSATDSVSSSAP